MISAEKIDRFKDCRYFVVNNSELLNEYNKTDNDHVKKSSLLAVTTDQQNSKMHDGESVILKAYMESNWIKVQKLLDDAGLKYTMMDLATIRAEIEEEDLEELDRLDERN